MSCGENGEVVEEHGYFPAGKFLVLAPVALASLLNNLSVFSVMLP